MFYKILIKYKTINWAAPTALVLAALTSFVGCGGESPSLKKPESTSPAANARENAAGGGLEQDLQTMRNADFDYIYVFRRKDGGVFDAEDKKYLKANSPVFTNRFVLTEENKAAVAGSSYKFEPSNLEKLGERFVIENFSKPEIQNAPAIAATTAANVNSGGKGEK